MQEIIMGIVMSFDVVALYLLLPNVSQRFLLSLWTAILHMLFPLIGFQFGSWIGMIITEWAGYISAILLFGIGLQLLLSTKNQHFSYIPLPILAIMSSLDTFSVSVSFGMLNLQMYLFILSAGIATFLLSYAALVIAKRTFFNGNVFKVVAGILLLCMSVLALWRQY
ncbi:manganese efflux pump [Solibacillus sp. CAU 1738]|uniref:manganese efflux pump MntP n=1 Tax=Solibacillus sp. CAU 1738 TaxID=3140363 RepID=UPI0032609B1D